MKHVYADGEWFTGSFKHEGLEKYVHIIRAEDDPERSPREERRGKETAWRKAFGKNTAKAWGEAILNHLSDDVPRTFNRIMVEIADATADVAFDKGPDRALANLVSTCQLEHTAEAPILFRRPPGWKKHRALSKGTFQAVCGRPAGLFFTGESVHDNWNEVTCLACVVLKVKHEKQQKLTKEDEMGMKKRNKTTPKIKKAPRKKKEEVKDPVNPVLAEGARRMFANALIASRKNGEKVVQGHCSHCGNKRTEQKTICLLCALVGEQEALGGEADERQIAKFLMVPERWLLDLISGFDKDGDTVTYRFAKRLGAGLWRKYGSGPKKARA